MKNIHILLTDQPSRVYNILGSKKIGITSNDPFYTENFGGGTQNQHIYITSDEEIKDGDYVCSIKQGYNIQKVPKGLVKSYQEVEHYKKIILTTDQDLINDGIQPIDDEFIQWFVKNPSCEKVETICGLFNPMGRQVDPNNLGQNHSQCIWKHKIIIPQEEPKQI